MIKLVPVHQVVPFDDFPYDFRKGDYPLDLLRSTLYAPDDPTLCDDDHMLVMDYDGFVKFFPKWNAMYREDADDGWYKDNEGEKYLPYHIGRTVTPIKGVTE